MDVAHPTAGWEQLGERFYRKTQLYTQVFDQDLDLDNYRVAGAPYGGAIGEWMNAWSIKDLTARYGSDNSSPLPRRRQADRLPTHKTLQAQHRHLQLRRQAHPPHQLGPGLHPGAGLVRGREAAGCHG